MLRVKPDEVDLDARAEELEHSRFFSVLGGMAFGGLAYLLVAGLFPVYFGATQGDDGHTVHLVPLGIGWLLVAVATFGYAVVLRRFLRFRRALHAWVRGQVRRDAGDTPCVDLEARLKRRSTRSSSGPADAFMWGGAALVPFGLLLPFFALFCQVTGIVDTINGAGASTEDWTFMLVALLPSALAGTLGMLVLTGIGFAGAPLRRWRDRDARHPRSGIDESGLTHD